MPRIIPKTSSGDLTTVQDLLDDIKTLLESISIEDFATETTLSAANVNLTDIEAILTAIRDTSGIKKITDALPAGDNNIGNVDIVSLPAPLSTTGGGVEATALRVTIATDSTGLISVDDNGGSLTVDGPLTDIQLRASAVPVSVATLPLPSGAATEATLLSIKDIDGIKKITDALPAGNNNIGDVDIVSLPAPLSTTGGGTEATALRVTIANDSTGLVSIDDNGGSITVDSLQLPAALIGGRLDENIGSWLGSTAPTIGQKAMANSIPMVIASDQTAIAISAASLPLPLGAATEATLLSIKNTDGIKKITDALPAGNNNIGDVDIVSLPAPLSTTGGGTEATALRVTIATDSTGVLSIDDNGGSITVDGPLTDIQLRASAVPISAAALPLPAGAATEATLATMLTLSGFQARINTLGQKAMAASTPIVIASDQTVIPISDNGGTLTVDSPQLPAALVGARLDINNGAWLGSTAPTVGQKTMANSIPITISSDQSSIPVTQSGTWTVQPGNTANTTAWLVTGTGGTFPITDSGGSITVDAPVATPVAVRLSDGAAFYDGAKTGQLPTALVGARLDINNGAWLGSTAPTVGQKSMANSIPVVIASDFQTNTSPATANITTVDVGSTTTSGANNQPIITGTATANSFASFSLVDWTTVIIQTSGTWTGTLQAEVSLDAGVTWVRRAVHQMGTSISTFQFTANFIGTINVGGYTNVRVRAISTVTGTATILISKSDDISSVTVSGTTNVQLSREFYDAFGRFRVSQPETLFDSKQIVDKQPLVWDDQLVSGAGGASTYNANQASTSLSVALNTAGRRVRQTFRRFNYQPGKSQQWMMTGIIGTPGTGLTRRFGLYDDKNGLFFESDGSDVRVVTRTFTSGSAVDNTVGQTSWNIDKLDGAGPSGVNINAAGWAKVQIFGSFFEWLGVGSVWFFVVVAGSIILVHRVDHANIDTLVYMSTPNLPLRCEIINSGTGAAASIVHVCGTVISEGGSQNRGISRGTSRGITPVTTLNNDNIYPMISIRLGSTFQGYDIQLLNSSIVNTTNAAFEWMLVLNPTVVGTALSFTAITNSGIEADLASTNATTITSGTGTILASGVEQQTNEGGSILFPNSDIRLGSNIAGTSDIIVFAVRRLTGTTETFYSSVNWREQG